MKKKKDLEVQNFSVFDSDHKGLPQRKVEVLLRKHMFHYYYYFVLGFSLPLFTKLICLSKKNNNNEILI
eukprot:gene12056-8308_t